MLYYRLDGSWVIVTETLPGKALQDYTYFVCLGNKQDTEREVKAFLQVRKKYFPGRY